MGYNYYVLSRARPGTRLGVYNNWLELAPHTKDYSGAIWKGYYTIEEANRMWEEDRMRQAQARNRGRNVRTPTACLPAPPSHVGGTHRRNEGNASRSVRSSTMHRSSTYAGSSSQATARDTSIARVPPNFPSRATIRSHSVHSSEDWQWSGGQPRASVDTSCTATSTSTQTRTLTITRTQSLAATSGRTSSWVIAQLPAVPESQSRTETTQTWARGDNMRSRVSVDENDRRATVDTSYSSAISVSSSDSSISDGPVLMQSLRLSSQPRVLASNSTPEVWIDNGFHSQSPMPSRAQTRSNRISPSNSVPAAGVTRTAQNSPCKTTSSSRSRSTPEVWHTALSCTPSAVNLVPVSESSASNDPTQPPQLSVESRMLASSSTPEVDSGFHSQSTMSLRAQTRSNRVSSTESPPAAGVTRTVPNSPHKAASSRSGSTPEVWHTVLSRSPSPAVNVVSVSELSMPSSSRSIQTVAAEAASQSSSRTPELARVAGVSSDAPSALTCQCRPAVCPTCHLPTLPTLPLSGMGGFGFVEPPHIANLVYRQDADPRSPMRRGSNRVPAHSPSFSRSSPPIVAAHTGLSSLFSS